MWMVLSRPWNQWPLWISWGINGKDELGLAWKYTFGHYVCICRKGFPAACKGFSQALSVLINDFNFSLFPTVRGLVGMPVAIDSSWCADMAHESGKGINEQELGRADVIPRDSLDELLLSLEGTVHQDSIYLGREGNIYCTEDVVSAQTAWLI